jgi:hypothetical protein
VTVTSGQGLTVNSGGDITLNDGGGLTVNSGGDIILNDGGDIELHNDGSDYAQIQFFYSSVNIADIYGYGSQLRIHPNGTYRTLDVGSTANKWNEIQMDATLRAYMAAGSSAKITVNMAGDVILQGGGGNNTYVSLYGDSFYPMIDSTVSCGQSGYRWSSVWAVNGTIQTSDERYKTKIEPVDLGLDFILDLKPVSFEHIDGHDQIRHYGLSAQDVEEILIKYGHDLQSFGGITYAKKTDTYGMNYSELIAPLIKSVQELASSIEELKLLSKENNKP